MRILPVVAEPEITPDLLLQAYCQGIFPMADGRDGEIGWYRPDPRAIQPFVPGDPLGAFRVRRSLAKRVRNAGFQVTRDRCFADVIHRCATAPRGPENGDWISPEIERLYTDLHHAGFAHSVEAWRNNQLVGGLYGVAIGAAFFGESMFSNEPDASQVCYVKLVQHLRERGYQLLDVQFVNPHLEQFGVAEIPGDEYLERLQRALRQPVSWQA
ncbi:MAG: leucyl/phenylalanyl-tRNA--protein transferase [Phycisphaeraceae bacterium]